MARQRSIAFFETCTAAIIRFRWLALIGVVLLTAFFMSQSSKLKFNGSFEIWFFEDDPAMKRLEAFKKAFGNDQFVYILAETNGVFQAETAEKLKKLAQNLEAAVPYVRDLTWIGNAEHIAAKGDTVTIEKLLADIPSTQEESDRRLRLALSEKDFVDRYVSKDGKAAGILIELERFPTGHVVPPPSEQVARAVIKVLDDPEFAALKLHVVGDPIFETRYNDIANSETPKFFALCILVQAVLLYLFTRSLRGVALSLVIVTLSFIWTLGTIALLGFDLDLMIIGLPVLLICVSIGDAVHAIADFDLLVAQGRSRREALVHSLGEVGLPCLLTSLTTAIGFAAFSSAPIRPFLKLGIYLPAGVMYAYVLTMVLVAAVYSFGRTPKPRVTARMVTEDSLPSGIFAWIHRTATGSPRLVTACFLSLMVLGLYGANQVEIESNITRYLNKNVPLRQDVDYVDGRMGGSTGLEIVIDTGRPDGIKDLTVLRGMQRLGLEMEKDSLVHKTFSVVDVLEKMRRAMHGDDPAYFNLPADQRVVPQYLALYAMSGGDQLDKIVSFDGSKARINLQTQALGSSDTRRLVTKVDDHAKAMFGSGVTVSTTGFMDIAKTLNDNMGTAQIRSVTLAFGLIAVVMMIVLRSVPMGLISMVPNIFPVFMVLGILGIGGIHMDTILMSVSAMIIGVAVDDTIHFFVRFRREFDRTGTYAAAIGATLAAVGRPIVFTTVTLSLGFLVLSGSVMTGWVKIGILSGVAFVWALLADLLFGPALLMLLRPLGRERGQAS